MIQSDNTVKEIRNPFSARVLCALCQCNVVDVATEAHLPVGHTHEDVDGCLSLVKSTLDRQATLETPSDMIRCLTTSLKPFFAERNLEFFVEEVLSVTCRLCTYNNRF